MTLEKRFPISPAAFDNLLTEWVRTVGTNEVGRAVTILVDSHGFEVRTIDGSILIYTLRGHESFPRLTRETASKVYGS